MPILQPSPARIDPSEVCQRLEELFRRTREPMLIGDSVNILDANAPMCALLRLDREAIQSLHIRDILAVSREEAEEMAAVRRDSGSVAGETILRRGDGSTVNVRFWSILVLLAGGRPRAFSGIMPMERLPDQHETNALLRDLFDDSPDGKLVVDDSGHTIYANQRHLDLWSLNTDDLALPFEGRWAKTAAGLADPPQFIAMQHAVHAGEQGPFRLDMADGRVHEVRAARLKRADGAAAGFSYTTRDFTPQVRARDALATHAALLEAVTSNSPDGIVVVDLEGTPLHYNRRFLDLWGVDDSHFRAALPNRIDSLLARVSNPERYREEVRRLSRPVDAEFVTEFEMLDGRIISLHVVPTHDAEGGRIGQASHFRDVTTERRAERELRDSENRFRTLVATLPVGVVMQFADGRIGECNAAAERILGLSRDELLGLRSSDPRWRCIHEDGSPVAVEQRPAVITLRTGRPCRDVVMGVYHANGALRWLLVNSEPIAGAPGVEAVVISFQDITEQRQGQSALIQSRTADAFNSLASGVAHKVNNSLATIVGNAYLAGIPQGVPPETVDSLTEIMAAASDATALVRDLQALSRRERHGLRPVDITEAAAGLLAALSPENRSRVVDRLEAGLPPVLFDPGALEQAMSSLLRNALEAGQAVSVETFVDVRRSPSHEHETAPRVVPAGRYLCFQVRDDGPGIHPSVAGRIFEPFVTTRFVGRGLGLAAAAGIMATHHGFVEVESSDGGCRARLLLPIV